MRQLRASRMVFVVSISELPVMSASDTASIINNPYDSPDFHWRLDERGRATDELMNGRRPSGPYFSVPLPDGSTEYEVARDPSQFPEPHLLINRIRERVKSWRDGGYTLADRSTRMLLEYWRSARNERRPFFCQMDAIETLIWLVEVCPKYGGGGGRQERSRDSYTNRRDQ